MKLELAIPDLIMILKWWLVIFFVGLINLPLTSLLFKKFFDRGWALSKTLGILLSAYLTFLFSTFKIVPFTILNIYTSLGIIFLINLGVLFKSKFNAVKGVRKNLPGIIISELLFIIGLFGWSIIRGFQPDIEGLEKLMDFGFINSILKSNFFPPKDMWFAGNSINYYWFGHYVTAFLTKLTNIPSFITYNIMLGSILGFCLSGVFSLVTTLVSVSFKKAPFKVIIAGILSAIILNFGGNFHTPYYILKNGADKYWYPDATRFIGYNPDTNDKTIHEFPMYSYTVSDLHGHLLNLPFVILLISFLWLLVSREEESKFTYKVFPLGFLLGIMFMTNTWDFGNYSILTGVTFGVVLIKEFIFNRRYILNKIFSTGISGILVFVTAIISAIPFLINFESIAQGIKFVNAHTPLWQLLILWGVPLIMFFFSVIILISRYPKIKNSDLFIFSLLICSLVLIIIPEIFYVKDIYIASHHRANTMFKLTYQSFVMSYLTFGYIFIQTLGLVKKYYLRFMVSLLFIGLFGVLLIYPYFCITSYYGELKNYRGLNGELWLSKKHPEAYKTVLWFRKNVSGQPTILEAPGDSYTDYNVISSYSGLPTVSGWFVHEWLWRGDSSFPQARVGDITQIYESEDEKLTKNLLKKYNVSYIVVGEFEREKFAFLKEEKIKKLGSLVFQSGETSIYQTIK